MTGITCNASKEWASANDCPSSLVVNGSWNASFSFDSTDLNIGLNQAVLTFTGDGAENVSVGVEVTITETAVTPTCTLDSADPTTVYNNNATNSSTLTATYSNFTGTPAPTFSCEGGALILDPECGATAGTCTVTCDYNGVAAGTYTPTLSLDTVICTPSVTVTVEVGA